MLNETLLEAKSPEAPAALPPLLETLAESTTTDRPRVQRLATRTGAQARVVEDGGAERVQVWDADDRLVFDYDPETRRTTLLVPGDLRLAAPDGAVELVAARPRNGNAQASLRLDRAGVQLNGARVGVLAGSADLIVGRLRYRGLSLHATLERSKLVVQKLETVAGRVIERARNVFRHVEELCQLRAGRVRTTATGSYQLRSQAAYLKAERHVKVNADKIHLG